jgi:hypothetical protein
MSELGNERLALQRRIDEVEKSCNLHEVFWPEKPGLLRDRKPCEGRRGANGEAQGCENTSARNFCPKALLKAVTKDGLAGERALMLDVIESEEIALQQLKSIKAQFIVLLFFQMAAIIIPTSPYVGISYVCIPTSSQRPIEESIKQALHCCRPSIMSATASARQISKFAGGEQMTPSTT